MNAEAYLTPHAVRETTAKLFKLNASGAGKFTLHQDRLPATADYVVEVIKKNYPDLNIPYHSRWGHFRAGNESRLSHFLKQIENFDAIERARIQFDLVIPSVLLDAGAGSTWKYHEESSNLKIGRSEGLGIASFYMFMSGKFSNDQKSLKSEAIALRQITAQDIAQSFQVSDSNPLVGLDGRAGLVSALGECLENSEFFPNKRVGDLVDYIQLNFGKKVKASDILVVILKALGSIWPGRIQKDGINLGDCWQHSKLNSGEYVVFHKLSQWLSYSLFEPLESAGFEIVEADSMTGLAEYRNGGLFVDLGVIEPRFDLAKSYKPSDDEIIEWRALTVQLLDQIAPLIRERLDLTPEQFPLAKVLEGGTWWAGRRAATERRADGSPPIQIQSDGTVF